MKNFSSNKLPFKESKMHFIKVLYISTCSSVIKSMHINTINQNHVMSSCNARLRTKFTAVCLPLTMSSSQSQSQTYQSQLDRRKQMLDSTELSLKNQITQLEGQLERTNETLTSQVF